MLYAHNALTKSGGVGISPPFLSEPCFWVFDFISASAIVPVFLSQSSFAILLASSFALSSDLRLILASDSIFFLLWSSSFASFLDFSTSCSKPVHYTSDSLNGIKWWQSCTEFETAGIWVLNNMHWITCAEAMASSAFKFALGFEWRLSLTLSPDIS